jgi:Cu/Ag efflux protein CusF
LLLIQGFREKSYACKKILAGLAIVTSVVTALATYVTLRPKQQRTVRHPLTGYVLEITPEMNRVTVRNDDMPSVMAPMVMDYRVKEPTVLAGIKLGDVIKATMVSDDAYWLEDITVSGKH